MRRFSGLLLVLFCLPPASVLGQEVELADFTPEQRWERAARHVVVANVAAIAYAKSMGQTVEDMAKAWVDLFAPGWGEPGSGSLAIVRGMHRNLALWPTSEFELVEQSERSITVRVNRPWADLFGEDEMFYGVSLQEYESASRMFNVGLAGHLGLDYEDWLEDGWLYFQFSLEGCRQDSYDLEAP